jgi:hypothetical protein
LRLCRGAKVKERLFRSFAFRTSVVQEDLDCGLKAASRGAVNRIIRYCRTNETSECLANLRRGGLCGGDVALPPFHLLISL